MAELLAAEVTELAGPKGTQHPARTASGFQLAGMRGARRAGMLPP
jgi:hypothetical protein